MEDNKHTTIILITIAALISLSTVTVITVTQQANALSIYDPDAAAKPQTGNTSKPAPIPTTIPTSPTIPTVGCAMDTIESLQSFLSCLGAK
jgi:hypothetical protein